MSMRGGGGSRTGHIASRDRIAPTTPPTTGKQGGRKEADSLRRGSIWAGKRGGKRRRIEGRSGQRVFLGQRERGETATRRDITETKRNEATPSLRDRGNFADHSI